MISLPIKYQCPVCSKKFEHKDAIFYTDNADLLESYLICRTCNKDSEILNKLVAIDSFGIKTLAEEQEQLEDALIAELTSYEAANNKIRCSIDIKLQKVGSNISTSYLLSDKTHMSDMLRSTICQLIDSLKGCE